MKFYAFLVTFLIAFSATAGIEKSCLPSEFRSTISVNKTSVDMRISKRGWITQGSVNPFLNLTAQDIVTIEYKFNPFTYGGAAGIFKDLEKEALATCRKIAKEEYENQAIAFPSYRYRLYLKMNHSLNKKNISEMGSFYTAHLETKCVLDLNLVEKKN